MDTLIRPARDSDFNSATRYLEMNIDVYFDGPASIPYTITRANHLISCTLLEEGFVETDNPLGSVSSNEVAFTIFNTDNIFTPTNADGPYFGKIKTGVEIVPQIRPADGREEWDKLGFVTILDERVLYFEFEILPEELPLKTVIDNGMLYFESDTLEYTPFVLEDGMLYYYEVDEVHWVQLGKFFVTQWATALTDSFVNVVANDQLYKALNSATPDFHARFDDTIQDVFSRSFEAMDFDVTFLNTFPQQLAWSFIEGNPADFLTELCQSVFATCNCNKQGNIIVKQLSTNVPVRAVWLDTNQIIDINVPQTIIKAYDGVTLSYILPQMTHYQSLLDIENYIVPSGTTNANPIDFTAEPVVYVETVLTRNMPSQVKLLQYTAGTKRIAIQWSNTGASTEIAIKILGTTLDMISTEITDEGDSLLQVSNRYIQDSARALQYKQLLNRYVSEDIPVVELVVRGNPLINIGDKIELVSEQYSFKYTGLVVRFNYNYAGGLGCTVTLLNEKILGGM